MYTPTRRLLFSVGLLLWLTACASSSPHAETVHPLRTEPVGPERILFIGNSYLYYNDSLHTHVRRIAAEAGIGAPDRLNFKSATISGARLSQHPVDTLLEPGRLGIDRPFDLVVLQGGSFEPLDASSRQAFGETVRELNEKIRAAGADVALYMTHAYVQPDRRYEPNLIEKIAPTYIEAGQSVDALVIPVGLAFERAYAQRPDIVLHQTFDGSHPSLLGTYLAACVVFQSLYGQSANDIDYDYFGRIDAGDATFLRRVADETVREFFKRDGQL